MPIEVLKGDEGTYESSLCCAVENKLPSSQLDNFLLSIQCVDLFHDVHNIHPCTQDSCLSVNSLNITRN